MRSELEAPLFAGLPDEELRQLLRPVDLQAGEVLFRQGEEADGLYVVAGGSVGVYSRLPGGGEVQLAVLGAAQVVGELALVDGGMRTATVRALEPTAALFFGRADFLALASRLDPTAFALKRRLAAIVCDRLRGRLEALSGSLDEHDAAPEVSTEALVPAPVPNEGYLVRLQFFRAFPPLQLPRLLAACRTLEIPAYRALLRAGARSDMAYVTLNGAVEEVLGWGRRRIRVRLAGPGHAVGYVGLLDGGPSPVTVATRERALLLAIPAATFAELFDGATALSYAFVEAVQRDLITAFRQAERPQARLAAAQQARRGGRSSGTSASVTSRNERANSRKR
ncbi:MAG TPA: cyclic nucleotide-binding domain-containing protein [Gaiellaceae bacterium]|nr:cyclic nucleotide-binding domain-containing protein [Gaiellaceae bacterium]